MSPHTEASPFDFDALIDRGGTGSIKWSEAPGNALAMGLADMDFRSAPAVLEALHERVEHGIFGYTQVGPDLTDTACRWLALRRGWDADPTWILPTVGVMPAIAHLLQAWLDPGAGVIVQTPAFGPIPAVVHDNGFRVEENPLRMVDGRYVMDLAAFEAIACRPDVGAFVLCSPHNPSGRVWARGDLESVAAICETNEVLVISDEVHADIVFPWASFTTYALAAATSRYAIVFGPSKAFNLAGLRNALAVVPNTDLRSAFVTELQRVNENFGIGTMASVATTAAYGAGGGWLDALTHYLAGNLDALIAGLAQIDGVRVIRPDASFLVWVDVRAIGRPDAEVTSLLSSNGVVVEPGSSFGPTGSGFIRVNIGTARSRVEEAAVRITSALGA